MTGYAFRAVGLALGAFIYTVGLDIFLVPNHVIDGGVVGLALMAAELTGVSFSVFIVALNIPFLSSAIRKSASYLRYNPYFPYSACPGGASSFTIRR